VSTRASADNSEIRCAIGACNLIGALSMAMIAKKNADGVWQALMGNHDSGDLGRPSTEFNPSNQFVFDVATASANSGATTLTIADGWVLVGVSKATGTVTPRLHIYKGGVWTHAAMSGSVGNPATQAGGTVRFFEYQDSDDFNGWIAVAGQCPSELADATFETLVDTNRVAWDAAFAAGGVWEFDDNPLVDYSAAGTANEIVRTATAPSSDNPGFYTIGTGGPPDATKLTPTRAPIRFRRGG
jgi:hypothetical protein